MFATTPNTVDDVVLAFCRYVVPDSRPAFVPVRPERFAEYGFCGFNVRAKIAQAGGERVVGWVVWLAPGAYIEAERHVVWQTPAGELIDVTPKPDGERTVLFVPEAASNWDGSEFQANVFRPLSNAPQVTLLHAFKKRVDDAKACQWSDPDFAAHRRSAEARIMRYGVRGNPRQRAEARKKERRAERGRKRKARR